ncbi:MAG TPA: polysaccharide deacetylase family protein, partial [Acidobacteriota bacterium]|nr:polysaccharide deacetylase family protein [Acidobacteriota bacterium]
SMKRREFLGVVGAGATSLVGIPQSRPQADSGRLHIVSLSFDDGFRKSFIKIAEIYEKFSFSACLNVIASAHMSGNKVRDDYMKQEQFGDFTLWNELQDRGHEIMPHGYQHAHLADLPLAEAQDLIRKCIDVFSKELRGFDPKKAVFNFPYNQSSPELEAWLPSQFMAFRTTGGILNPLPKRGTVKITTGGFGPGNAEKSVDEYVDRLLAQPSGWMVYNLHGLDDEGWGPIRPAYLERLLGRLREIESVRVVPTARALMQAPV